MPTWAHFKEQDDFNKLVEAINGGMIWVHRPLYVHERAPEGNTEKCPCGCDSIFARHVETIEHIDVLIDPVTGIRRVLQNVKPEHVGVWHRLAAQARKIDLPHLISRKQLEVMSCGAKVIAIFGGSRGGKTTHIANTILSAALMYGGEGSAVWWVAPTQGKTEIGLEKLAIGEKIGKGKAARRAKPMVPDELLHHVPSSPKSDRAYVELVDGSKIHFKYASKDGGNLKGQAPVLAIMDEGCEVKERQNYSELNRRLMEGDGQLMISTTPVAGHWLKEEVYDVGVRVEDWKPGDEIAWTHITAFDNPWVSVEFIEKEIRRHRKTGGEQEVRREIYGEWVSSGPLLWKHFDEKDHVLVEPSYRVPADLGLVDVTAEATQGFFLGQKVSRYLGQDFNLWPMAACEIQVAYHPDDPKKTPIVIVPDEIVAKIATIYEHMESLKRRGYAGAGVSCDATGAQANSYRLNHGITDKNSTQALEMRRNGFVCYPCRIGRGGTPSNPSQIDKISPLHRLMMERIELPNGKRYARFLIHDRCQKTLVSLRTQESDSRGNPKKESNTVSDRASGPSDALCYGLLPIEHYLFPDGGKGVRFDL